MQFCSIENEFGLTTILFTKVHSNLCVLIHIKNDTNNLRKKLGYETEKLKKDPIQTIFKLSWISRALIKPVKIA